MTIRCVEDHDARTLAVHACAEDGPAGQLVGVAVQKPPRGPLLSDLPVPAAHALAAHFAGTTGVSSVGGLEAASAAVAGHYAALAGVADRELWTGRRSSVGSRTAG